MSPLCCWHHVILVYFNPQENILVKRNGEPCICDFGTSKIVDQHGFTTAQVGTYAFMAPELFPPESRLRSNKDEDEEEEEEEPFKARTTRESDVYSYGLVALLVKFLCLPRQIHILTTRDRFSQECLLLTPGINQESHLKFKLPYGLNVLGIKQKR